MIRLPNIDMTSAESMWLKHRDNDSEKGGPGSGNHGHAGVPGKHGGSSSSGGGGAITGPSDSERTEFATLVKDVTFNERQQAVADEIGEEEVKALMQYATEDPFLTYKSVNPALRTGVVMTPDDKLLTAHIDSGLSKLDSVDVKSYRGIVTPSGYDSPEQYIEANFKVGQITRDDAFMSASQNRKVAESFSNGTYGYGDEGERGIIFEVYSAQGKDISKVALRTAEKEILFPRSTRLVVDATYFDDRAGKHVVVLADPDYNGKSNPPATEFMRGLALSDNNHRASMRAL